VTADDVRAYQDRIVGAIGSALAETKVEHAVTLSSIGADKIEKTGPVVGLHNLEQELNKVTGLNVLHLRAGYFMENTLAQVEIIKSMGIAAGPLRADLKLPMIATRDIGAVAGDALLKLQFQGKLARELQGQRDLTMAEAAAIMGNAIGKPDLQYKQLPDEQVREALTLLGLSLNMANLLLNMSAALNSGHMRMLEARSAGNTTPTSYEQFVTDHFVLAYQGKARAA
jgi:uncharacterized protein YbjT (DUF2867 family)